MRLIDADEANAILKELLYETAMNNGGQFADACVEIAENRVDIWIGLVPTVDPVKHGRWIDTGEIFTDQFSLDEFPIYECSVCGSRVERKPTLDRFCNWCGARMDEVEG